MRRGVVWYWFQSRGSTGRCHWRCSHISDGMHSPFDAVREAGAEVDVTAGLCGLAACYKEQCLCHQVSEHRSDAHRPGDRLLVKCNKPTSYECPVGCPRRLVVAEPAGKVGHGLA